DVPVGPAAGRGLADRADAERDDGAAAGGEGAGALRRPGELAPAAGAGAGAEGVAVDLDAGGDGLPELGADDARRDPLGLPGAGPDRGDRREPGPGRRHLAGGAGDVLRGDGAAEAGPDRPVADARPGPAVRAGRDRRLPRL